MRPLPLALYLGLANLAAPLAYRNVARKLEAAGVSPARQRERMGHATAPRPEGRLIWFHAASVGESLSVLRLIAHWAEQEPETQFLLTSGTATSAEIVAKRLPERTRHQFAPLDSRRALRRFVAHWRPALAVFVESELWPRMLTEVDAAGIPRVLINARLSDKSLKKWAKFGATARALLSPFRLIHCQDTRTETNLRALGLTQAQAGTNLKSLSGALPVDATTRADMRAALAARPLWCAASTHKGEDDVMLAAHGKILETLPETLLILAPRHPERAQEIAAMIHDAGLSVARRSQGEALGPETQVYLADTLGEMGLWYDLSPVTCLCGSFTAVGGHNPYEPAHAGSALIHGPLYANFADTYAQMRAAEAGIEVAGAEALAEAVSALLTDPAALETARAKAHAFATAQSGALDDLATALSALANPV